jgi:hypothetical protein
LSVRHGAYADVKLGARVDELAALVRETVPAFSPGDEIGVRVLCLALARLEQSASAQAGEVDVEKLARLRQDERGWANTVRRYLADLGLTPLARARLGVDLTRMAGGGLSQLAADGRAALEARSES